MVTNAIEPMKQRENKQLDGYIFPRSIALVSNLIYSLILWSYLLCCYVVWQVWKISLASMEYDSVWHQLKTLRKYLGKRGLGDYWSSSKFSSCCSHCLIVLLWTRAQSDNIRKAAWLSRLTTSLIAGLP